MDKNTCEHPPERVYCWYSADDTFCAACCDCGAVLAGNAE